MDIDEEFKKLDEVEIKEFEKNEELMGLLSNMRTSYKKINFAGKDIRIRSYMAKQIRKRILKISHDIQDVQDIEGLEAIEKRLYPLIAAMCIDAPYNDAKTWQYLDDNEGCIQDVTSKILLEVNKTDKEIKTFR